MDLATRFDVSFVAQGQWDDPFSNQGGDYGGVRDIICEEPREARVAATVLDRGRLEHCVQGLGALVDCQTFESFIMEILVRVDRDELEGKVTLVCGTSGRWVRI